MQPHGGSPQLLSTSSAAPTTPWIELPTAAVAFAVYSGYLGLTWFFRDMPLWVGAPLCAMCLTWFGSLQHETIHGHPTPWRRVNRAIASLPLSLWLPYRLYRATHLQHHRHGGRNLTDVDEDPESFYMPYGALSAYGHFGRALYQANCTLPGRLILGPAIAVFRFWNCELRKFAEGHTRRGSVWARHIIAAGLVSLWITRVCHIPITVYLFLIIYPSISLTLLRSFAEHRAHPNPALRTVTVECNAFWALLFLNNNLHIAHHAYPKVPWYELPSMWRQMRGRALADDLVLQGGYLELSTRYLCRAVISVEHPTGSAALHANE